MDVGNNNRPTGTAKPKRTALRGAPLPTLFLEVFSHDRHDHYRRPDRR
jgi:hypothetical protein